MSDGKKHPILRLEVLAPDGTRATDQVVFCGLQSQSVRVEDCCRCAYCSAVGAEEGEGPPSVDCAVRSEPPASERDRDGERTAVGELLCRGTLVLDDLVPLGQALELLRAHDLRSVAIVDSARVMVGLLYEPGFAARVHPVLEASAVSGAMSSAVALGEATPVRTALKLLAANHLREATVVSKRGVPIGTFRDVDGLLWIASARREEPPEQ
jgi:CBS domain-containing protein